MGAGSVFYVEDTEDVAKEFVAADGSTYGAGHLSDGLGTQRNLLFIPAPKQVLKDKGCVFGSETTTVHFIRHGEAATNKAAAEKARARGLKDEHELRTKAMDAFIESMSDPLFADARLTANGKVQAAQIPTHLAAAELALGLERGESLIVLCSTLSRALATATVGLVDPLGAKVIACEALREFPGPFLADKRRSVTELQADFPHVDFSPCTSEEDDIWQEDSGQAFVTAPLRAVQALEAIVARPEKRLVAVSHNGFMSTQLFGDGKSSLDR
jgi:broad specificity phosphatase PhoE